MENQKSGYGIMGMTTNQSYLRNSDLGGMRQSLTKTFDEICILGLNCNSLKKRLN